jgi:deoxycytidylate deaminase
MQRIVNEEYRKIEPYFKAAAEVAAQATCLRANCGSVIVKDGKIIGEGFNSPALGN